MGTDALISISMMTGKPESWERQAGGWMTRAGGTTDPLGNPE